MVGGINQPFAGILANELERQCVTGPLEFPMLAPDAGRFLAGALRHLRPEVYGPNPTITGKNFMIRKKFIRQLRNIK